MDNYKQEVETLRKEVIDSIMVEKTKQLVNFSKELRKIQIQTNFRYLERKSSLDISYSQLINSALDSKNKTFTSEDHLRLLKLLNSRKAPENLNEKVMDYFEFVEEDKILSEQYKIEYRIPLGITYNNQKVIIELRDSLKLDKDSKQILTLFEKIKVPTNPPDDSRFRRYLDRKESFEPFYMDFVKLLKHS